MYSPVSVVVLDPVVAATGISMNACLIIRCEYEANMFAHYDSLSCDLPLPTSLLYIHISHETISIHNKIFNLTINHSYTPSLNQPIIHKHKHKHKHTNTHTHTSNTHTHLKPNYRIPSIHQYY